MVSFILSLLALVLGYALYGKFVEHIFGPDDRPTPAVAQADGVDYLVLPSWRIFMIQFLNIAGTGPIFGAIMGAWYGPVAYLWIVFGCIFAGAVHDYFSGMLSIRHKGANLPQLVGHYLGQNTKRVMLVFSVFLLMIVGVVFVYSPALILKNFGGDVMVWIVVIFLYYVLATILPIDKIIGKLYPIFGFSLLFMAVALMIGLFIKMPDLPELWSGGADLNRNTPAALLGATPFMQKNPAFPCMCITIACGAISGFHATQSPLMARCVDSERKGRRIFYGAMITEGVVTLVWVAISIYFFYYGGWRDLVGAEVRDAFLVQVDGGKSLIQYFTAPNVVERICTGWLGIFGGFLAMFGVVAAPITTGDTAFRSARLIIAEAFHVDQKSLAKRFVIAIPMFVAAVALLAWQIGNPDGFNMIWQWLGWSNQALSIFTLWAITVYLVQQKKPFVVTLVPALFMTVVCGTFLLVSPMALGIDTSLGYVGSVLILVVACVCFFAWYRKAMKA